VTVLHPHKHTCYPQRNTLAFFWLRTRLHGKYRSRPASVLVKWRVHTICLVPVPNEKARHSRNVKIMPPTSIRAVLHCTPAAHTAVKSHAQMHQRNYSKTVTWYVLVDHAHLINTGSQLSDLWTLRDKSSSTLPYTATLKPATQRSDQLARSVWTDNTNEALKWFHSTKCVPNSTWRRDAKMCRYKSSPQQNHCSGDNASLTALHKTHCIVHSTATRLFLKTKRLLQIVFV